jgi:hypothetical protein
MTSKATVEFLAILFTALALIPAGAHLIELLNKIDLPAESYLVVQQIYRGWALAGFVVFGALLATLALAFVRRGRRGFLPAVLAFLCIVGTQVIFWSTTYPANVATANWTMLPENWDLLRARWEYSHAASSVLNLAALCAATIAVLRGR